MNKTQLLRHLTEDLRCQQLYDKKLRKILEALGINDQRVYNEDDVKLILEAIKILDNHNNSEEGYNEVELSLGRSSSLGRSNFKSQRNNHHDDSNNSNAPDDSEFLLNILKKRHAAKSQQLSKAFFESPQSYQMFKAIAIQEMGNAWADRLDGWIEDETRPIKNISSDTIDVDAETQSNGGLPGGNNNGDDDDVEDFHNTQDDN